MNETVSTDAILSTDEDEEGVQSFVPVRDEALVCFFCDFAVYFPDVCSRCGIICKSVLRGALVLGWWWCFCWWWWWLDSCSMLLQLESSPDSCQARGQLLPLVAHSHRHYNFYATTKHCYHHSYEETINPIYLDIAYGVYQTFFL